MENVEPILENLLLSQREGDDKTADLLETNIQATLKVAEAVEENAKKVPTIKIQIDGAEATTYQGAKGERGEDGKTPVKGEDYFTKEDIAEIATVTARLIPKPKDGKDGKDGESVRPEVVASILRSDKALMESLRGKNGKDASVPAVVAKLLSNEVFLQSVRGADGENGQDGRDGTEITAQEVKDKLLEVGISYSEIKDAPTFFKQASKTVSLSELDDVDLSGVTQTNGKYVLGGGSGAVDSVNGQTGVVVLDTDDITDTATNRFTNDTAINRLANTSGTNTGDVSVNGEDYLSLTGQAITANPIDLDNLSATGTPSASTFLRGDNTWATPTGTGDVVGPASATDNAVARFDTTTGKLIQNSVVSIDDAGVVTGVTQLNVDNLRLDGNTVSSTDTNGNINLTPNGTGVVVTPTIRASGSGGIALQNSGGTSIISLGGGGGVNATIAAPVNIGTNSADYIDIAGGTGTTTQTAAGSSTNINVNIVPKGTGRLQASGVSVPTISSTDALTNKDISGASNTYRSASDTVVGAVELATSAETTTGTDATRAVTPDGLAGSSIFGRKSMSVYVVGATTDVSAGDGQYYFMIPEALNGMNLVRAIARVVTAGTTNATTIDIFNVTDSVDMLSTAISIASGGTLATAGTVNTSTDDVATNDLIRIDVTSVSTTKPKGLIVEMEFQLP
jgi:hypothetical protein